MQSSSLSSSVKCSGLEEMAIHSATSGSSIITGSLLLLFSSLYLWGSSTGSTVGVNYGFSLGTNLPSPSDVLTLLQAHNIDKVKIFNTDATVLNAFQGSGITLIVGVENSELQSIASSQANADQWVKDKIVPYASSIKYVAVGNEVIQDQPSLSSYVLPAMTNINNALVSNGIGSNIKVTTPVSLNVLQTSYPPSAGRFQSGIEAQMIGILQLIQQTGSKFTANVYPFFTYMSQPSVGLEYSTFGNAQGVDDNGLHYSNLFDAQVDALVAAMSALGYPNIPLLIGESGWPTQGDPSASVDNAKAYNNGLVAHVPNGSPKRPGVLIETYIFELFNEDQKPGGAYERYWGLFNGQSEVYDMSF